MEKSLRDAWRKCLEAMNVALLNPDVKERLLRPGVADMLLELFAVLTYRCLQRPESISHSK
eukprot:6419772-Amphidinium_carterae.1